MRRNRIILAVFAVTLVVLGTIFHPAASQSDIPPPVYGVEITGYDASLTQAAGAASAYEVAVENIGVMDLTKIRLGAERIDPEWFSSSGTVALKFGEVATLTYELDIPESAEGMYAFSIVAFASSGSVGMSNEKIVSLDVVPSATTQTTGTTTPLSGTTTIGPSTQPTILDNQSLLLFFVSLILGYIVARKFL